MDADPGLAVVASRRHVIDEESRVLVPRRGLSGLTGMRTGVGEERAHAVPVAAVEGCIVGGHSLDVGHRDGE